MNNDTNITIPEVPTPRIESIVAIYAHAEWEIIAHAVINEGQKLEREVVALTAKLAETERDMPQVNKQLLHHEYVGSKVMLQEKVEPLSLIAVRMEAASVELFRAKIRAEKAETDNAVLREQVAALRIALNQAGEYAVAVAGLSTRTDITAAGTVASELAKLRERGDKLCSLLVIADATHSAVAWWSNTEGERKETYREQANRLTDEWKAARAKGTPYDQSVYHPV